MLNTIMHTAPDLLLNTVFYLMGISGHRRHRPCLFVEFGVVKLLENILRPLMRPLFICQAWRPPEPPQNSLRLPRHHSPLAGPVSAAIRKFQYISLTNFGTTFGMGLLGGVHGRAGATTSSQSSAFWRLLRLHRVDSPRLVIKAYPSFAVEDAVINRAGKLEEEERRWRPVGLHPNTQFAARRRPHLGSMSASPSFRRADHLYTGDDPDLRGFGSGYTGAAYEGIELLPQACLEDQFHVRMALRFSDPLLGSPSRLSVPYGRREPRAQFRSPGVVDGMR